MYVSQVVTDLGRILLSGKIVTWWTVWEKMIAHTITMQLQVGILVDLSKNNIFLLELCWVMLISTYQMGE